MSNANAATIPTRHGDALVLWDEQDPSTAGWFLRYSNGTQDNLDEILSAETLDDAISEAISFLRINGGIVSAQHLMREAVLFHDADWTTVDPQGEAIRLGERVLVMGDGTDDDERPVLGYAWTSGRMADGEYIDETGSQWATTADEARAAIAAWIAAS